MKTFIFMLSLLFIVNVNAAVITQDMFETKSEQAVKPYEIKANAAGDTPQERMYNTYLKMSPSEREKFLRQTPYAIKSLKEWEEKNNLPKTVK